MKERIIQLLRSEDVEMIILGATILNSIGDLEKEIEIFAEASTESFIDDNPNRPLFPIRVKIVSKQCLTAGKHINIIGQRWNILIFLTFVYLTNYPYESQGAVAIEL